MTAVLSIYYTELNISANSTTVYVWNIHDITKIQEAHLSSTNQREAVALNLSAYTAYLN